jgi:hypothetical protein
MGREGVVTGGEAAATGVGVGVRERERERGIFPRYCHLAKLASAVLLFLPTCLFLIDNTTR